MKLYTKTGDDGTTGLFGGGRVQKSSARVSAYGTVDELNATLGVARASKVHPDSDAVLAAVQVDLFTLGAELATVPGNEHKLGMPLLGDADAERLEKAIDAAEAAVEPLKNFVLPGGSAQAAALHMARTVCRRAEREVLALGDTDVAPRRDLVIYLNRLSDLLFVLARKANVDAGVADVPWVPHSPLNLRSQSGLGQMAMSGERPCAMACARSSLHGLVTMQWQTPVERQLPPLGQ